MRTARFGTIALVSALSIIPVATPVAAQTTDSARAASMTPAAPFVVTSDMVSHFAQVTPGIVKSAGLGRGKTALLAGGAFMLPYMQQLAMDVERAGASAAILVTTDSLERIRATKPAAQRGGPNALGKGMMTAADIWFVFPQAENQAVYAGRTPEQLSAAAHEDSLWRPLRAKRRAVFVGVPLPGVAVANGYVFDDYARSTWESMAADYTQLAKTGGTMRQRLAAAKTIHVTSPEGTDLTFALAKGTVFLDAGPANTFAVGAPRRTTVVPGGQIVAVVTEPTANGKLRAPADFCKAPVKDEAIDIVKGRTTSVRAASDEACVQEAMGKLHISSLTIGLNPTHPNVASGGVASDFTSPGLVVIGFGGNTGIGGTNVEQAQWVVPLTQATVTADGVAIVRDGKLVP
jgi:aminopeptidase